MTAEQLILVYLSDKTKFFCNFVSPSIALQLYDCHTIAMCKFAENFHFIAGFAKLLCSCSS